MHYYQFNIKDYAFATMRMSLMEDLAFRRMLDLYYETEKPLHCELKRIAKNIGMLEHQEEVRSVLNEFWTETADGWVNDRATIEISAYQAKLDVARANGKKGGRPKTHKKAKITQSVNLANPEITQSVNLANPEITGLKANHKPLTINQEPIKETIPYQLIVDSYHSKLKSLPRVAVLSDKRKTAIKICWNKAPDFNCVETWEGYFEYIASSDFLVGKNNRGWVASFDFVTNLTNMIKIIEGSYANG